MAEALDDIDRRLLDLLVADGRASVNALADAAGVSRANAYRRLDRLRDTGVIRGFAARLDHAKAGRPVTVLILVSVEQHRWREVRGALTALPEVDYLAATTGEFDFLALVRVGEVTQLRDVVLEQLHAITGVVSTRTVFVLDEQGEPT